MHYVDREPDLPETALVGGDVTEGLVRRGDTVRRPRTASSSAVETLLRHVEATGFDGAPRHLGTDDRGREVVTFIAGDVAIRPWPDWVAPVEKAESVARLVRRYDDAALTLGLPPWAADLMPPELAGQPPSTAGAPEFLAHLDITPENTVFRDGEAVALIDFDLVRPATRTQEVANLLLWWGPWMPPVDREDVLREADATLRASRIVDAYGLDTESRARLVDVSRNVADRAWWSMRWRAETLGGGWKTMWDDGVGDKILRRQAWLAANAAALHDAVAG